MKMHLKKFYYLLMILALLLPACSGSGLQNLNIGAAKSVTISIVYGSEKQLWLDPQIKAFNDSQQKISDGSIITVQGSALGSICHPASPALTRFTTGSRSTG